MVQGHYGRGGVLDRILAALEQAGCNLEKLNYQDLFPFDQLHARGIAATREQAQRAGIRVDMHVLDVGCGIGAASRYLAATTGCRVTSVDLTQEFVDVARELTRRCGLGNRVLYRQANALHQPFADGTFDHVWCHNVTMNIQDKKALAAEVARVLRPGGRFSCSELARGPTSEPTYPSPWATDSSSSFLATPAEMRAALEAGGLRVVEEIDLTDANRRSVEEVRQRAQRGEPPLQAGQVVMGKEHSIRLANSIKGIMDGALLEHLYIAEKP